MSTDRTLEAVGDGGEVALEALQPRQSLNFSNLPIYFTPEEAAEYLRFTSNCDNPLIAFGHWAKRNHVPVRHRGTKLLYRRVDLDRATEGVDFLAEAAVSYTANAGPERTRANGRGTVNGRVRNPYSRDNFPDSQISGGDVTDRSIPGR